MEQVEFVKPLQAAREADGNPELLAPNAGTVQAFNHLDKGDVFPVDRPLDEADPASYDALVLPGGVANPDQLRTVPAAVDFVRAGVRVCTAGPNALITSRKPDDLPAFCRTLVTEFQRVSQSASA